MRFLGSVTAALFLLLPAASASATDYCVLPEASCTPGNRFASVQTALSAAQGPGADRVLIGAGTFDVPSGGLTYNGDRVEIVGAGSGSTVLRGPTTGLGEVMLSVTHSGAGRSRLTGLGFRIGPANPSSPVPNSAVLARGGFDVSAVEVRGPESGGWGVELDSLSTLAASSIELSLSAETVGVFVRSGPPTGDALVEDSAITAFLGTLNDGGRGIRVRRTSISTNVCGICGGPGPVFAENVLVKLAPDSVSGASAFSTRAISSSSSIDVRNSTAVGGNSGSVGLSVESGNPAPASGTLTNSIIRTPGVSLRREYEISSGSTSNITASHNAFHPAAVVQDASGHGSIVNTAPRTDDPLFLGDPALGEFRLRHDSPLIDAGNPGAAPTPTDDFEGDPRPVDGNGDGSAVRDLGAFEYQRKAPAVTAAAAPAAAFPGDPITWTASGSDPDGDPLTYSWSWDDGATGSGASVTHAFTPLGSHSGTVTATDPTGLSSTSTATAEVRPRPLPPGDDGDNRTALDRIAPKFSLARRALALSGKNVIAVRLSCDTSETEPCAGTLSLASAKKLGRGKRKRALQLGRAAFSIAPGKSGNAKVKVSKRTARVARGLRRFKVKATATARDRAGNKSTKTGTLTLSTAAQRKKR